MNGCMEREEGMGIDFLTGSTRYDEMSSQSEYSIRRGIIRDLDPAFEDIRR